MLSRVGAAAGASAGWLLVPVTLPVRLPLLGRPTARVDGFGIYVRTDAAPAEQVVGRLAAALGLLAAADPRRLARVRADAPRIYAGEFLGAGGYWWTWPTAITFDARALLEQPALWAALTIAHEGTHARLRRAGIRTTAANRARVERRCVAEQIAFLRRGPPEHQEEAARWLAWSEESLRAPAPWYEPEQQRASRRRALAAAGAPKWLLRLFGPEPEARVEEVRDGGA